MPERVGVRIAEREFGSWTSVAITLGLDTVDTIALSAPFEAERREFRELFRPLSFPLAEATLDRLRLFTGTLVDIGPPNITPESRSIDVAGYSLPGVLQDCSPPASALPLEWREVGLRNIAEALCAHFGIDTEFNLDEDPAFEQVALDPLGETKDSKNKSAIKEQGSPWSFLTKLAQQRRGVLTSSSLGKLRIWTPASSGRPVAFLRGGLPPLVRITPTFAPQDYYSEVTGFAPGKVGRRGSRHTVSNLRLGGAVRPYCFTCSDSEDADVPRAATAKLGRMFGNAATWTIEGLPTWRDPSGALWSPNTFVRVLAPDAMIYEPTDFLVRSVTLRQDSESETADLHVCFPGAFGGETPSKFPWDD